MDRVFLPLIFEQRLFTDIYELDTVIQDTVSTLTRVCLYKNKKTFELIIIKIMPDYDITYKELHISDFVNKILRDEYKLYVFVESYGYVLQPQPYKDFLPEGVDENEYFIYLAIEYVPFSLMDANITLDDLTSIILELLATLYIARRNTAFHHGDIHTGNIMLDKADYERQYKIGDNVYTTKCNWMPRLIDFGKNSSHNKIITLTSDLRSVIGIISDITNAESGLLELYRKWSSKLQWKSHLRQFGEDSSGNYLIISEVLLDDVFQKFRERLIKRTRLKNNIW